MRWDSLFADLDGQAETLDLLDRSVEVEERSRIEIGKLASIDRLRANEGARVSVRGLGGIEVSGVLARVGPDWLLLEDAGRDVLIAFEAVVVVRGLGRLSLPAASGPATSGAAAMVASRLGLTYALRLLLRDRLPVQLHLADRSVHSGTIDRVGSDYVDLALHPADERLPARATRESALIPLRALVAAVRAR